jgi:hypothetical protein
MEKTFMQALAVLSATHEPASDGGVMIFKDADTG